MPNKDIVHVTRKDEIKRIRYEKWCPKCDKNILGPPIDVPVTRFGQKDPAKFKSTMVEYSCPNCRKRYRISKEN